MARMAASRPTGSLRGKSKTNGSKKLKKRGKAKQTREARGKR